MRILFKQFFNSFKKNHFNIFSLSILTTALCFVISGAVNLSSSFISSINYLNGEGDKAGVVSEAPKSFGRLDFSYSTTPKTRAAEGVNIIGSSLSLVPSTTDPTKFERKDNTLFCFNKSDFIDAGGKAFRNNNLFEYNNGYSYNPNETDITTMFKRDDSIVHPIWANTNGTVRMIITDGIPANRAFTYSFVNPDGKVLYNPANMIFNKWGVPTNVFSKGNLVNDITLFFTSTMYNKDTLNTYPNWCDDNGVAIAQDAYKRTKGKEGALDKYEYTCKFNPASYELAQLSAFYPTYEIGKYIKVYENVPTYDFTVNLSSDSSTSSILKTYLSSRPNAVIDIFNEIFQSNNITRGDINYPAFVNGKKISDTISIKKDADNNVSIQLALPDEQFIDPTDPTPAADQLVTNKTIYLNNFSNNLSSLFTSKLYDKFLQDLSTYLVTQDISMSKEEEYFTHDAKSDLDMLFVNKGKAANNSVVVSEGSNIHDDNDINEAKRMMNARVNGKVGRQAFYALYNLLCKLPQSVIDSLGPLPTPSKAQEALGMNGQNRRVLYNFTKYLAQRICAKLSVLPTDEIPSNLISDPDFRTFGFLMSGASTTFYSQYGIFRFSSSKTEIACNPYGWINPVHMNPPALYFYNFQSSMVLINEAFAIENKKKYLPKTDPGTKIKLYKDNIDAIVNNPSNDTQSKINSAFAKWYETLSDENKVLSESSIIEVFKSYPLIFDAWKDVLPSEYKINYQNNSFLINGFALSPDFAFPILSPTSPIPNPQSQVLIYVTPDAFNGLGYNENDVFSYYSYLSTKHSDQEVVDIVNNYMQKEYGTSLFNIAPINEADFLQTVWLRTYFPTKVVTLVAVFAIVSAVFLLLLSLFTISFLMKSLIKNLLEPISICIANGTPFSKVLWAILFNIMIITTTTSMLGFTIAYFLQKPFLSLFSSIWFIPTATTWFTPTIFVPLMVGTFGVLAILLTVILKKAFKKPVPEIIANKESIKINKFTNAMRNTKIKMQLLPKMSFGFSSINLGRLGLLAILGALSVGTISSSITINAKFNESSHLTQQARDYNYEYQLQNVNESTGLYKAQSETRLGFEDLEIGIVSLYGNNRGDGPTGYPYTKADLQARQVINHTNKLEPNTSNPGYLSNLVLPSYAIYQDLQKFKTDILYNSVGSIFLLKVKVNIMVADINIWDFVEPSFPTWVVDQMEHQVEIFKDAIMKYYGEWYYKFLDLAFNEEGEKPIINNIRTDDNDNPLDLHLNNVTEDDSGYYYAEILRPGLNPKKPNVYRTKTFYVWPDSSETYWDDANAIAARYEPALGTEVTLDASKQSFTKVQGGDINKYDPTALGAVLDIKPEDEIIWHHIPAYNNSREFSGDKISGVFGSNPVTDLRLNDEMLRFISVIFSDPRTSVYDAKLTCGIIPYDPYDKEKNPLGSEKVTKVNAMLSHKKGEYPIEMYGIKPNSNCFPIIDSNSNEEISSRLFTNASEDNTYNVIVNNGFALKYAVKEGDTFNIDVLNNSLSNSYNVMNNFVTMNNNPINNKHKIKVVGISSDSFGEKVYIDQKTANNLTGLDKMHIYGEIRPPLTGVQTASNINRIQPDINDYDAKKFPFNTIVSKEKEMSISKSNVSFYTYANCWCTLQNVYEVGEFPKYNTLDSLLTFDHSILLEQANQIKNKLDASFDATDNPDLRNRVLNYYDNNFNSNKIKQVLENTNNVMLLKPAQSFILPTDVTNEVFNIVSNLSTTLIVTSVSLLIPLLILVCISTCLSVISGLMKQINLLKVLGYSNRNIIIMLLISFLPVFIIASILGLGMVFGISYGIQFIIFNLSSVFIYPYVQPLPVISAILVLAVIFSIALIASWTKMNRSKLDTAIKF